MSFDDCQSEAGENPGRGVAPRPRAGCVAGGGEGEQSEPSLPCLYSNICIEEAPSKHRLEQLRALCGILAPYQKRQAHTLFSNVERLVMLAPSIGHIGFFSLTTKDVTDKEEFSKRWHSMRSNYWAKCPHFGNWLGCFEQQARGAWHLHLIVTMPYDIREGINFEEFEQRRYKSASPYLRSVWRDLRGACLRYGFGRHELMPIKSNAEAMARYVGKYISKHIGQREEAAKGKRLVTSSQGWMKNSVRFSWNTEGAKEWRRKVRKFAAMMGCKTMDALYLNLGPNWAYKCLDTIYHIDEIAAGRPPLVVDGFVVDPTTGEILF